MLKSIELEKQKLLKIQQQKNKITTLLQTNTQPVNITKQNIQPKQTKPIISNNNTLSSYDKINNLNTNSIFKKKEKLIPDVIEPITLPKETKQETINNNVKPKPIIKDKKNINEYTYYTKKDFPNLNWDIDKKPIKLNYQN